MTLDGWGGRVSTRSCDRSGCMSRALAVRRVPPGRFDRLETRLDLCAEHAREYDDAERARSVALGVSNRAVMEAPVMERRTDTGTPAAPEVEPAAAPPTAPAPAVGSEPAADLVAAPAPDPEPEPAPTPTTEKPKRAKPALVNTKPAKPAKPTSRAPKYVQREGESQRDFIARVLREHGKPMTAREAKEATGLPLERSLASAASAGVLRRVRRADGLVAYDLPERLPPESVSTDREMPAGVMKQYPGEPTVRFVRRVLAECIELGGHATAHELAAVASMDPKEARKLLSYNASLGVLDVERSDVGPVRYRIVSDEEAERRRIDLAAHRADAVEAKRPSRLPCNPGERPRRAGSMGPNTLTRRAYEVLGTRVEMSTSEVAQAMRVLPRQAGTALVCLVEWGFVLRRHPVARREGSLWRRNPEAVVEGLEISTPDARATDTAREASPPGPAHLREELERMVATLRRADEALRSSIDTLGGQVPSVAAELHKQRAALASDIGVLEAASGVLARLSGA